MSPPPRSRPAVAARAARTVLGALVLTMAAYELHELTHHLVGRLACGPGGRLTLTQFDVAAGCSRGLTRLATLAGPAFSIALAWVAARAAHPGGRLAPLVVFASFAHLRALLVLRNTGDEALVLRQLVPGAGTGARLLVAAVLLALVAPALARAWRALDGPRRGWRFAGWCVMPVPALIGMDRLDAVLGPWIAPAPAAGVALLAAACAGAGWALVRRPGARDVSAQAATPSALFAETAA
jgi:hypothetical protein